MMNNLIEKIKKIDWKSISPAVYTRYILMILTALNTILTRFGINPLPFSEDGVYQAVSDVITVAVVIINTWFDNPVTPEALEANAYMQQLKDGTLPESTTESPSDTNDTTEG